MKCFTVGDPHFKLDNLQDVDAFISQVLHQCTEIQPDFIVVLGDILHYHEKIYTVCLNRACDFLINLSKISKTFLLIGNHDMVNCSQFLTDNHPFNTLKYISDNLVIVDKVIQYQVENLLFTMLPFVPNGRFVEALNTVNNWMESTCIFAHQEFKGCKMGAIISEHGDDWPLNYPQVISGHIHDHQIPQQNILYVGSSFQHAFGDSTDKFCALVDFNQPVNPVVFEKIRQSIEQKKILRKDITELTDTIVEEINHKTKLVIHGDVEEFKAFQKSIIHKQLCEKGVKIKYQATKAEKGGDEHITTSFNHTLADLISDNTFLIDVHYRLNKTIKYVDKNTNYR